MIRCNFTEACYIQVPGLYECIMKASKGIEIPEGEDVDPDSDRCVAISTRSSVREMVAPGTRLS